eukprot:1156257-Pelagomonas_calceolata.AAC.1
MRVCWEGGRSMESLKSSRGSGGWSMELWSHPDHYHWAFSSVLLRQWLLQHQPVSNFMICSMCSRSHACSARLLPPFAGLDKRDAKLIFSWSQLSVLDELKKRKRTVALTQWDFIEVRSYAVPASQ